MALLMATSTRLARGLVGEGAVSVARARRVAPLCAVAPPVQVAAADDPLVKLANEFIHEKSGFYSPYAADAFADDFVFRGPVIGPLNKADYLSTMDTFKVYKAFPRPTLCVGRCSGPSVLAAMGPLRAPDDDILLEMSDDLMECKKQLKGIKKQFFSCDMQLETCAARACCVCD